MRVSKEQREALQDAARKANLGRGADPALILIPVILADLDDAEQRAERAEAELAALRERVRGMADNADRWAEASLSRDINGNTFGATVTTDDLRHLLDDDTTGAASGEGEK